MKAPLAARPAHFCSAELTLEETRRGNLLEDSVSPALASCGGNTKRQRKSRGVTLVEAAISLMIMSLFMIGFMSAFIQSRRVTEASVLHAAATSVVYGIIEQIKGFSYDNSLPFNGTDTDPTATDPNDPDNTPPPCMRIRINQGVMKWIRVKYTQAPGTPLAPTTTPAASATAASVGGGTGAIDNWTGEIPLSTVTGTTSQRINLNLWVWVDEIPDAYVTELKRITIVYTYLYQDGSSTRTIRNREVFLRSRYDQ